MLRGILKQLKKNLSSELMREFLKQDVAIHMTLKRVPWAKGSKPIKDLI